MRRRGLEPMHDEHVNVTPLIDVIMCLIVFFLCCSTLAKSELNDRVEIPRAKLGQEMPEARGRVVINLLPHGRLQEEAGGEGQVNPGEVPDVIIGEQRVPYEDLTNYLRNEKRATPDLKVIVRASQALNYEWVSPVLVSCVQANINSVSFSTRKE